MPTDANDNPQMDAPSEPNPATPPTSAAAVADYPEPIHFARQSGQPELERWAKRAADYQKSLRIGIGAFVALWLLHLSGTSLTAYWFRGLGWAWLVLSTLWYVVGHLVGRKSRKHAEAGLPQFPDESHRLRCVGTEEELTCHGAFENVPFEPAFFNAAFALRFTRLAQVVAVAVTIALMVALLVPNQCTMWLSVWFPAWLYPGVFIVPLAALSVVAFLWPSYLRVVPGRLDIIRYCAFTPHRHETRSIDLRSARILIDLRAMHVQIGEKAAPEWECSISLLPHRTRFAYMLFWAAMSRHDAPPIPDGELLG